MMINKILSNVAFKKLGLLAENRIKEQLVILPVRDKEVLL
jgi:hypothetical protein